MYKFEESQDLKKNEKYSQLMNWALDNGVILHKTDLPAYFGQGLIGVVATEDIPSNTATLCVPQKLIISQEKCFRSELAILYKKYPDLFNENETQDAEFNVLILYLFVEKKKGKESFYYPYIQAIQDKNMLINWCENDLNKLEDPLILDEFQGIKQDLEELWLRMQQIVVENVQFFQGDRECDREDFYWAAQSVMSRCFGWSLKSTSMVPIADFLNHSNLACTHHFVQKELEQMNIKHEQYILKNRKLNLQALDVKQNIEKIPCEINEKVKLLKKEKKFLEEMYVEDVNQLSTDEQRVLVNKLNYKKLLDDKRLNLWDLEFATSTDSEDNDSDEEIDDMRSKQFTQLFQKEKQEIQKNLQSLQSSESNNIITVCLNKEKENKVNIIGLPINLKQQQQEEQETENQMVQKQLQQEEQEEQYVDTDQESYDSNNTERSEESKWDWLNEDDQDGYFCITSTFPIKKGEQLYVSYGRRTNRFLLCWYGFAIPDNKYSSYNFRLWLNLDIMKKNKQVDHKEMFDMMTINQLMREEDWENGYMQVQGNKIPIDQITKEFRLKKTKMNLDLLMYMRLYLMMYYTGKDVNKILITIPVSLDYEIFVMQFTIKLLNHYLNKFSQGVGDDIKQLESLDISVQERFALIINKERKEILVSQIMIFLEAIIILKRFKECQDLKQAYLADIPLDIYKKMNMIHSLKEYLKSIHEFM